MGPEETKAALINLLSEIENIKPDDQLMRGAILTKPEEKPEEKTEKIKELAPFVVMNSPRVFDSRIQINSNDIKHLLIQFDSGLIREGHLIPESIKDRETKLVRSRFNVFDLINDGKQHSWLGCNYDEDNEIVPFIQALNEYDEKFKTLFEQANKDKEVPFYSLPYILTEGKELAHAYKGVIVSFICKSAQIQSSFFGVFLQVVGNIVYHDGKDFIPGSYSFRIGAFEGDKTLSEVGIKDLSFYPELREQLVARGKKYFELHENGPHYASYKGSICRRSYWKDNYYPATGRIMVDRGGMANIDPDYEEYFGVEDLGYDKIEKVEEVRKFTEKDYQIASPYCYGFSLNAKKWGEFILDDVSEISFRTDAYAKLVLDEEFKKTMFSLVEYRGESKDIIDNKGGGCIFLLHGAPGVGKTLTAEAISETLHRPLYMVSVGELGTSVATLDKNLRSILEIASSWNAVLLIDEVDIFLEKRDLNIERNALVGVFLRLLEYYNGILFMTTNRVKNIDPAFYSRISLAIKYPDLSVEAKGQIWDAQLKLYNIKLSAKNIKTLAEADLNGRQIKNCIRITTSLAEAEHRIPVIADFLKVLHQIESFNKILEQAQS